MPSHARAAAHTCRGRAVGYDYAGQDPINSFDLDGTAVIEREQWVLVGGGALALVAWECVRSGACNSGSGYIVKKVIEVLQNAFVPAPRDLPAFPDAKRVRPKTAVQGGGGLRRRWKGPDGKIYEWDSQHGTVEVYDRRGRHLGEFDPNTGEQIKPPTSGRKVEA